MRVASGGRCVVVRVLCERERERRDRGASEVLLSEEGHSSHFTNNTKLWPYCYVRYGHTTKPSSFIPQSPPPRSNVSNRKQISMEEKSKIDASISILRRTPVQETEQVNSQYITIEPSKKAF